MQQDLRAALSCFMLPSPQHSSHLLPSFLMTLQELANLMWAVAKMDYYPGATMVDALTQVGGQLIFVQ